MDKKQIILFYTNFSTFVEKDYYSLSKKSTVIKYQFKAEKQVFKFLLELLKLKLFLIKNIRKTDILYCWFADYHSLLPSLFGKIFNKKTVIIVGGHDAVSIPEIEYGIFYKKNIRALFAKYSYRFASLILPVHRSLIEGTNYYLDEKGIKTGVKYFVSNLKTPIIEMPTGYDENKWYFKSSEPKQKSVVTIAGVKLMKDFQRKGLPLFIEVARLMKETEFIIIGVSSDIHTYINKNKPDNLIIYEYIKNDELINYISKSKVYCQFSLSEGLPNVLCEAMLCECIPVGSSVNGIPDGIGEYGFVLDKRDVFEAVVLVKKALASDESLGKSARKHIIDHFSHERREAALFEYLKL